MVGYFITYVPSIIGITTPLVSSEKYYFNLDSESEANFILELGFHQDIKLTHHIFLRPLLEFQFSGMTNGSGFQFVETNNGNIVYSSNYSGSAIYPSHYTVSLANLTLGIGYKL